VNGIQVYYEWHGSPDAPVLVLNNGILMNAAASWARQTTDFARHYRVLQYDCRGQGQSDHPGEPYSMEGHADDLAGLLVMLGVSRAHVAGISYGGEVAQAFALRHPDRVLSLVLADTVSEVGAELHVIARAGHAVCWERPAEFNTVVLGFLAKRA
jgi:3-oxoadipate enol-lactonase